MQTSMVSLRAEGKAVAAVRVGVGLAAWPGCDARSGVAVAFCPPSVSIAIGLFSAGINSISIKAASSRLSETSLCRMRNSTGSFIGANRNVSTV